MCDSLSYKCFLFGIVSVLLLFVGGGFFFLCYRERLDVFTTDQIWEVAESLDGKHQLTSVINHKDGLQLYMDGVLITPKNLNIAYSPAVNNRGDFAYSLAEKNYGTSMVMLNGKAILDDGTLCNHFAFTNDCLLFSSFSLKDKKSTLYIYRLQGRNLEVMKTFYGETIVGIQLLGEKCAAVLVEQYEKGRKYSLYNVNLQDGAVSFVFESDGRMFFARGKDNTSYVDRIPVEENTNNHILLNSWYWFYHYQYGEPFSCGNDFCGRLSWNESYRMQGILVLYRKIGDSDLREALRTAAKNILDGRNGRNGILEDEFNPSYLWSSKRYSIDGQPVSLMVNNGMILETLLSVANEGILDTETANEVYSSAQKAFLYYEPFYDGKGHYVFQPGGPIEFDGIVLPWNQQNVMASVWLELWRGTGVEKYLRRAEEMLGAFRAEWVEENGKVRWRYWPNAFYAGWGKESGISKNTPTRKPVELSKVAFEDISHAGVNAGVVAKYYLMFPRGVITEMDIEKIHRNMENWCFSDGFSVSIGGGEDISYRYVPSSGWGYFRNKNMERYVCYGRPQTAVDWDSQVFFGLAARQYEPGMDNESLIVERYVYNLDGEWGKDETFSLQENDIKEFVKESYGEKKNPSWKDFSWDQKFMVVLKNLFSTVIP